MYICVIKTVSIELRHWKTNGVLFVWMNVSAKEKMYDRLTKLAWFAIGINAAH